MAIVVLIFELVSLIRGSKIEKGTWFILTNCIGYMVHMICKIIGENSRKMKIFSLRRRDLLYGIGNSQCQFLSSIYRSVFSSASIQKGTICPLVNSVLLNVCRGYKTPLRTLAGMASWIHYRKYVPATPPLSLNWRRQKQ